MKKAHAISPNAEKEYSPYEASNKYTEQDIKDAYKVAQNWTACLIKCAAHMGVELDEGDA